MYTLLRHRAELLLRECPEAARGCCLRDSAQKLA
jgi:hypothetical protein